MPSATSTRQPDGPARRGARTRSPASRQFCREHDVIGLDRRAAVRSSGRRCSCAPTAARSSTRRVRWTRASRATSSSRRRPMTPRPSRSSPTCARTTTGCSGCCASTRAVPGHYLQLAWSNRSPSLTRTIFSNGMFAEGWAVYVEQVMMDLGYGADEPALMLTHWKFYLRAITNAILDVEIHTRGMTEEEAIDLMVRPGLPGGGRGAGQVAPRAAHLDPAVRPTTWARGDVRPRGRGAKPRGGRRRRLGRRACRRSASSAASARRPASTTGRTSSRSSPTARRPSGGCDASSNGRPPPPADPDGPRGTT